MMMTGVNNGGWNIPNKEHAWVTGLLPPKA